MQTLCALPTEVARVFLTLMQVVSAVSKLPGVSKVLYANSESLKAQLAESVAPVLEAAQKQFKFTHIISPSSAVSKSVLPRLAGKLDVAVISDVTGIKSEDTFTRSVYAGAAVTTVKSKDAVKILTIRTASFNDVTGPDGSLTAENVDGESTYNTQSALPTQTIQYCLI